MDWCPHRAPSGAAAAAAGTAFETGAGVAVDVRAGAAERAPAAGAASRRVGALPLLRAAYRASRIARWASTLLTLMSLRCPADTARREHEGWRRPAGSIS